MSKLLIALFATLFAATAGAQTPAPSAGTTPQDPTAARRAASPDNIKGATAGTEKGYTRAAGENAEKAAASKDKPMATLDAASKRDAVKSATASTQKGYTQAAGDAAAKASGSGSEDAKAARRAASRENIKGATASTEKGYTQAAGDAAAKAREEAKASQK